MPGAARHGAATGGRAAGRSAGSAALRPVRRAGTPALRVVPRGGASTGRFVGSQHCTRCRRRAQMGLGRSSHLSRGRGGVVLGAGWFLGIGTGVCSPAMSGSALKQPRFAANTGRQSLFGT